MQRSGEPEAIEQDAQEARAQKAQEAKTRQDAVDRLARMERLTQLSRGLQMVYSEDFNKKITPDFQKIMKDLVDERFKLDEKAIALRDKCLGITTPLFACIAGTMILYGVVNVTMLSSDVIGLWRTSTLLPFIYLINYYKENAHTQFRSMKEEEMPLIKSKREELIRKMNQLRCFIDLSNLEEKADDEMIPEGIPTTTQNINEEAAGDNFFKDCEKILAPMIDESYFQVTTHKINTTFMWGIMILGILGLLFLAHAFFYFFFFSRI